VKTGGKCGGSYVDRLLDEFMSERFGLFFFEICHEFGTYDLLTSVDLEKNKRIFVSREPLVPMRLRMKGVKPSLSYCYHERDGEVSLTE
jgi:hypothetical protein